MIKRTHSPVPPAARVLAHPGVAQADKERLQTLMAAADPVLLFSRLRGAQEELGKRVDRRVWRMDQELALVLGGGMTGTQAQPSPRSSVTFVSETIQGKFLTSLDNPRPLPFSVARKRRGAMDWTQIFSRRMSRMKASEIRELLKLLDQPDIISFAGGIPDPALFPVAAYQKALTDALTGDAAGVALQYSVSEGYAPLRRWLAEEMGRLGVACGVENIFITSGSQQALDYLGKLLLSPGDAALVNWPTYMGALGAFNAYEPNYLRLNGNSGAAEFRAAAEAAGGRVKFAYLSADFGNPTGETLDRAGREALLDLAEELDIAVIEDGAYQHLRYDGAAIPPILALELARVGDIEACRTLYCGSFSKTLAPGLRVGWVCGASSAIQRLVLLKQAGDLHSPTLNQIATTTVVGEIFAEHVDMLRQVYGRRRMAVLEALAREMPEGVTWTKPEGGMFVWLTLPEHIDGAELLANALKHQKVAFVPGRAFFADGAHGDTIRLSFSLHDKSMAEEGVKRIARAIREMM